MIAILIAVIATTTVAVTAPVTSPEQKQTIVEPADHGPSLLPEGTPVRLMILREINGHTAKVGDRFKLRVDEPIYIDGKSVVPVGATAWGEIALVEQNGAIGKGGRLTANLLFLDLPNGKVPLRGGYSHKGAGNGAGVVLAIVGFGIPGLLMGGDSGRLKAGDTFTGYVASSL
ncbi:MAG TPA: hypothetical protein VF503_28755 [Sphingobium sp.]|uniref:hypothetical protein n=1 Tax=Sphingobium sp. TaxID=1912891 RepID=UPI002ED4634F